MSARTTNTLTARDFKKYKNLFDDAKKLLDEGFKLDQIALKMNCSVYTLHKVFDEANVLINSKHGRPRTTAEQKRHDLIKRNEKAFAYDPYKLPKLRELYCEQRIGTLRIAVILKVPEPAVKYWISKLQLKKTKAPKKDKEYYRTLPIKDTGKSYRQLLAEEKRKNDEFWGLSKPIKSSRKNKRVV